MSAKCCKNHDRITFTLTDHPRVLWVCNSCLLFYNIKKYYCHYLTKEVQVCTSRASQNSTKPTSQHQTPTRHVPLFFVIIKSQIFPPPLPPCLACSMLMNECSVGYKMWTHFVKLVRGNTTTIQQICHRSSPPLWSYYN